MLKVGLTGGMGSGKSTVAKIFETLHIPVYYADDAAKRLMNENAELKKQIIELLGNDVYENGVLNRKKVSERLFQDPALVKAINAIVHPVTIADAEQWMESQTSPYCIKEAALIFESGSEKNLDIIITVVSPLHLRIQRLLERDNTTEEAIRARMKNQLSDEEKINRSDYIIFNDEEHMLIPQVLEIHQQLLQISQLG